MRAAALGVLAVAHLVLTAGSAFSHEASLRQRGAAQEVVASLYQLRDAQMRRDLEVLGRIYTDDYTLTEDDGTMFSKGERIAAISKLAFDAIEFEDIKVRTYSTAAAMTYRVTARFQGEPRGPFRFRVTMMWVKGPSGWQVAASHESFLESDRK